MIVDILIISLYNENIKRAGIVFLEIRAPRTGDRNICFDIIGDGNVLGEASGLGAGI